MRKIRRLTIIFLSIMLVVGCIGTVRYCLSDYFAQMYWREIAKKKQNCSSVDSNSILSKYSTLYTQNNDLIGWINMCDGQIDYPVMQNKYEPEFYLLANFDKEYDPCGTPFVDYRCDVLPYASYNTIIYGHYTSSDSIFRRILDYSHKAYYEKHKMISFDTITEECTYDVVAACYYDATDSYRLTPGESLDGLEYEFYNYIEIDSVEGFQEFKNRITQLQLYETGNTLEMSDHIITIICCAPEAYSGYKENGRFVIIAKKK